MVEISHVIVSDLKESVIACRNAMRTEMPEYTEEEFDKSLPRAIKLVEASRNGVVKCHDNFLTGIRVAFDIKYPNYFTPELQRYHFLDIVTSSSKMHKLVKMNMDACFNKYVTDESKAQMKRLLAYYNSLVARPLPEDDEEFKKKCEQEVYEAFMAVLSNCPLGVELFMRCNTNYKSLQTIYHQRKNHRLKEDWGAFCDFIRGLPYAKEFITGEEKL